MRSLDQHVIFAPIHPWRSHHFITARSVEWTSARFEEDEGGQSCEELVLSFRRLVVKLLARLARQVKLYDCVVVFVFVFKISCPKFIQPQGNHQN